MAKKKPAPKKPAPEPKQPKKVAKPKAPAKTAKPKVTAKPKKAAAKPKASVKAKAPVKPKPAAKPTKAKAIVKAKAPSKSKTLVKPTKSKLTGGAQPLVALMQPPPPPTPTPVVVPVITAPGANSQHPAGQNVAVSVNTAVITVRYRFQLTDVTGSPPFPAPFEWDVTPTGSPVTTTIPGAQLAANKSYSLRVFVHPADGATPPNQDHTVNFTTGP